MVACLGPACIRLKAAQSLKFMLVQRVVRFEDTSMAGSVESKKVPRNTSATIRNGVN